MNDDGKAAAAAVRAAADLPYAFGMVLGSGLGPLADAITDAVRIPYADLPGCPVPSVSAHAGVAVAGRLEGVPVIALSGRAHYYENADAATMRPVIGMLRHLGCHSVFITSAAGSVREDVPPAAIMLITDHINLAGANPLIGETGNARFVGMTRAYDPDHRAAFYVAALEEGVALSEGVYAWFSGPSFETPAEIRAARVLGADAVGMSLVPEVILARFFGLRVIAVSVITNYGAGITGRELSHQETLAVAPEGGAKLERALRRFLRDYAAANAH